MKTYFNYIVLLIYFIIGSNIAKPQIVQPMQPIEINYENLSKLHNIGADTNNAYNSLNKNSIRYSFNSLISIKHPWTPSDQNIYLINSNLTYQKINRRLFVEGSTLDLDSRLINTNHNNAISFILDPDAGRIIYSQKSGDWIRSYGDNAGDYEFFNPKAITVDSRDTIFVVDHMKGKIVKLYYNNSIGRITFISEISIPGILHPLDISIEQSGGFCCPYNDKLWIIDAIGKIVQINRSGVIQKTIEYYTVPGTGTYRIINPAKILSTNMWGYIGLIDRERNAFIVFYGNNVSNTTVTALGYTEFSKATSQLTCIGLDLTDEWWVSDEKMRTLHKFSWSGEYLASFDNRNGYYFTSPQSLSKAPWLLHRQELT